MFIFLACIQKFPFTFFSFLNQCHSPLCSHWTVKFVFLYEHLMRVLTFELNFYYGFLYDNCADHFEVGGL